jgi:hypothetical protein
MLIYMSRIRFGLGICVVPVIAVVMSGCSVNPEPPMINDNFLNTNSQGNSNASANDNGSVNVNDNATGNSNSSGTTCTQEGECPLGTNCVAGACAPVAAPDLVIGDENPFALIPEGGTMIVRRGFQGGNHIFMSVQTSGFPFTEGDGRQAVLFTRGIQPDGTPFPLVVESTVTQFLQNRGEGTGLLDRVFVFIDGILPPDYDGRAATVFVTVTDAADATISATLIQRVILRAEQ